MSNGIWRAGTWAIVYFKLFLFLASFLVVTSWTQRGMLEHYHTGMYKTISYSYLSIGSQQWRVNSGEVYFLLLLAYIYTYI